MVWWNKWFFNFRSDKKYPNWCYFTATTSLTNLFDDKFQSEKYKRTQQGNLPPPDLALTFLLRSLENLFAWDSSTFNNNQASFAHHFEQLLCFEVEIGSLTSSLCCLQIVHAASTPKLSLNGWLKIEKTWEKAQQQPQEQWWLELSRSAGPHLFHLVLMMIYKVIFFTAPPPCLQYR